MIELRALGTLSLAGSGDRSLRDLLGQPRRLALLAYLAIASPRGPQRRDRILLLFWPELDQSHARAALRQALYVLRDLLGDAVLLTHGDDAVGVNPARVWCDVAAFDAALDEGRLADALELYRGDLLDGFFVKEAPDFERWLDEERARLRSRAGQAATSLALSCESRGDSDGAVRAARTALRLAPHDELVLRRLLELLDRVGDRAGAIAAYEEFARRLAEDLEAEPAPETQALVAAVRTRETASAAAQAESEPGGSSEAATPARADVEPAVAMSRARRRWPLIGVLGLGIVAVAGLSLRSFEGAALDPRRVVVAPLDNRTGDSTLDQVGELAADWITRQVSTSGVAELADAGPGLRGFGASPEDSPRALDRDPHKLALGTGAGLVVGGSYYRRGDSLEFEARITDERRRSVVGSIEPAAAPAADPRPAIQALGQRVSARLAMLRDQRIGEWADAASQPPTLEAYREFSVGVEIWHIELDARRALPHFYRAAALDSTFTLPLVWAAWAHRGVRECARTDSIARVLGVRQLASVDRALLDREVAMCRGDPEASYQASTRLLATAPGSEEFAKDLAHAALRLQRPREALAILLRLHPDRGALRNHTPYHYFLTWAYHELGEHDRELTAARRARALIPNNLATARVEMVALATLGRLQEIEQDFAELPTLQPHSMRRPGPVMRETALELLAHGYAAEGREALRRTAAYYESRPAEERATEKGRLDYVLTLLAQERWSDARPIATSLLTMKPHEPTYLGIMGLLAAATGNRPAMEARVRELETIRDPYLRGAVPYWRACIAARLGQHDQALSLLQDARAQGWELPRNEEELVGVWDLHIDPCFASMWNDRSFQEFVRPRG